MDGSVCLPLSDKPLPVFREFDVEGVTELSQREARGQGAEPAWSSQQSPDCSDASTGSVEQQQDAGQSLTL